MNQYLQSKRPVCRSTVTSLLVIALMVLLSACGGTPKREGIDMQVSTTMDVNPDMQGRPSPIILYILELSSTERFNRLDYMSLTHPSGTALGPELLGKNQLVLQPGERRELPLELNPLTTSIGLVAGYRNIDNATWRTNVPINQGDTKSISVTLEQQQIVIFVSD